MSFPTNYNSVNVNSFNYAPLKAGGHKCKVLTMDVGATANGNRKITITFDTTMDDIQPNFYVNSDRKGKYDVIVDERLLDRSGNPYGLTNLKRLMTSFEDSNAGFHVADDNYGVNDALFCMQFINKNIGFVMGEEEYISQRDGAIHTAIKAKYPCGYDKAFDQKVPNKKTVERPAENIFIDASLDDAQLPFN